MATPKTVIQELERLKTKQVEEEKRPLAEGMPGGGVIFQGRAGTELFRLLTIRRMMLAEARGMRLTAKAPKATTILRRQYGLKGNRESLARQLDDMIEALGGSRP